MSAVRSDDYQAWKDFPHFLARYLDIGMVFQGCGYLPGKGFPVDCPRPPLQAMPSHPQCGRATIPITAIRFLSKPEARSGKI